MRARKRETSSPKGKRGPKPENLMIPGDWEEAVKKALKKPPPSRKKRAKKT